MTKIFFGIHDVLSLDAWLDYFEVAGAEVDGSMTGADMLGSAEQFQPDYMVTEYDLIGEWDGLAVFSILKSQISNANTQLILIVPDQLAEELPLNKLNNNFIQSSGIKAIIPRSQFNFERVEQEIPVFNS